MQHHIKRGDDTGTAEVVGGVQLFDGESLSARCRWILQSKCQAMFAVSMVGWCKATEACFADFIESETKSLGL